MQQLSPGQSGETSLVVATTPSPLLAPNPLAARSRRRSAYFMKSTCAASRPQRKDPSPFGTSGPCQPGSSDSGPRERSSVLWSWNYINPPQSPAGHGDEVD